MAMKSKYMTDLPLPFERDLFFTETVDQESIRRLSVQIIGINNNDVYLRKLYKLHDLVYTPLPIKIYIDSYGGYVYQCLGLIGIIETSKVPIQTIVTGVAMSCGFLILISGHERFGYKHSTPLYHQISSTVSGKLGDIDNDVIELKRLQKKLEKITLSKTNITKKKLRAIYKHKVDWFMTPKQALKYGVIDYIIK